MDRESYRAMEGYMLSCMGNSAHDAQHVYRVLYAALDIAGTEAGVDRDILAAACLLHDVGRGEQLQDPSLCHAEVGSEKAYAFLTDLGWSQARAGWVRDCVLTHRFRSDRPPASLEAKILFDADKLDVTGAIGIARTLCYGGEIGQDLYRLGPGGEILTGPDTPPSFFREYNYKLRHIADGLYTRRAKELAAERQAAADAYYDALLGEVKDCYERGRGLLGAWLEDTDCHAGLRTGSQ